MNRPQGRFAPNGTSDGRVGPLTPDQSVVQATMPSRWCSCSEKRNSSHC